MTVPQATVRETVSSIAVSALESRLLGRVIRPGDSDYDQARQIHNLTIDRHPAVIVRCGDAADVIRAVQFAQEHDLPIAVRSGGHSPAGQSMVQGGIVIDLSHMRGMSIDPARKTVWAQPGVTSGYLAPKAAEHNLALTTGDAGSVALGGLTLGGGIGWLVRKHGLTIDHLLSAELVTADGRLLKVSEAEHPDLFWALRGGGGNFGIVTGYEFQLEPLGLVLGGVLGLPATPEVLRAYTEYAYQAPDDLTTIGAIMRVPPLPFVPEQLHGTVALVVIVCYAGDVSDGQQAVAPLRGITPPLFDHIGPMPYPALYEITKESTVAMPNAIRSVFTSEITVESAAAMIAGIESASSPVTMVQIRPLGGALARVPADATAFAHRDARMMVSLVAGWFDPAETSRQQAWVEDVWAKMQPAASGAYVNFLADEGEARIREAYPPATYARLAAIKRQYDPGNVFRLNQNIQPAAR